MPTFMVDAHLLPLSPNRARPEECALMETADINGLSGQLQSCACCFDEHIAAGVHDGKISMSGFSLNVTKEETLLSCV